MQQVRLLKQAVHKLYTFLQWLMITCNEPVMEIIKVFYSPVCICLFADCLKLSNMYNLKCNFLAEYSLLSTHSAPTFLYKS